MTRLQNLANVELSLALLLVCGGAAAFATISPSHRRDCAGEGDRTAISSSNRYVCPMHPQVVAEKPGLCPICRMPLEQVKEGSDRRDQTGGLELAAAARTVVGRPVTGCMAGQMRGDKPRGVRAPAWVESAGVVAAILYDDELCVLAPDGPGSFVSSAAPQAMIRVRVASDMPSRWDASTSLVHFRADSSIAPSEAGWVVLERRACEVLVAPSEAILDSPNGSYVLVPSEDGLSLERRFVQIGRRSSERTVVLSGLRDQERVVNKNAFFVDADRRLREVRIQSLATR